ncbi:MAG: MFS transporter [Burkholderiales bacterium]
MTHPQAPARPVLALASTLSVQAVATVAMSAASVLAPLAAPALGVPASQVGWFVGLAYGAAMSFGLGAGVLTARHGPIRVSQMALAACMLGLLVAAITGLVVAQASHASGGLAFWAWVGLPIAALAIGAGYGLPNPSASMILAQHAPPHRRGLFFSIKQTGVPIGVGIAGLSIPALLLGLDWPWVLVVLAAACFVLMMALQKTLELNALSAQGSLPDRSEPTDPAGVPAATTHWVRRNLHAVLEPLARIWALPAVRRLALASLAYSMTQLCFVTFLVSYLKLEHGMSLAAAAGVLSSAQILSVISRVGWGQVADAWMAPLRLLGLLGLAMGCCAAGLGLLPVGSPAPLALLASMACAATSMAWNGVYFAELAHRVAAHELPRITAGTQFLTFLGAMAGPMVFSALVGPIGSHGHTYAVLAGVPALIGIWLLVAAAREKANLAPAAVTTAKRGSASPTRKI